MRAVVLRQIGGPEALVPEAVPDPSPGPGEVVVRVRAAAVCGRDLIDRRGGFPMMKLPTILGHEFAGEVMALGPGAEESGLAPALLFVRSATRMHRASRTYSARAAASAST